MEELYKLNDGHITEAVDRIYVAQMYLYSSLSEHALIDSVPEFSAEADRAIEILGRLYQLVASYDSVNEIHEKFDIKPGFTV